MKFGVPIKILGVGLFLGLGVAYASNTIRVVVPAAVISNSGSYMTQEIHVATDTLRFINKDNDTSLLGDYFIGEYYDSAYGTFSMDKLAGDGVRISNEQVSICDDNVSHEGHKLEGKSFSSEFGSVNFNFSANTYVYLCVPRDENSEQDSYLSGKAFGSLIGVQDFSKIFLDAFIDRGEGHESDGRYVRIEGLTSSQNIQQVDNEFENEVRVLGDITKSSLRKEILQEVYSTLRNTSINNGSSRVTSAGSLKWDNAAGGVLARKDTVLYFSNLDNTNVELVGTNNIGGNKTLVVEGGNIYVSGNIRNNDNDDAILGLMAIEKDGKGGNIYIDPDVTDIHAIIYASKSIESYVNNIPADGTTPDNELVNQLYVYGSLFSENTLGGAVSPYKCPFYVNETCDEALAKRYDLNYLRRYILSSQVDDTGNLTGIFIPSYGGEESYLGDNDRSNTESQKPGYRVYPFIVEYNPSLQQSPPPFF